MQIEFKVRRHELGKYTLMMKKGEETLFTDCKGLLLGNEDAGSFYKAVAATLYTMHVKGDTITYQDHEQVDNGIPEARRFGEQLMKHGLTLAQASFLSLNYVPQDPYKGQPEKAADEFFAEHGHKYR